MPKDEYPQLSKLDGLERNTQITQSNAKLCEVGVVKRRDNELDRNVMTMDKLCHEGKKSIKFDVSSTQR